METIEERRPGTVEAQESGVGLLQRVSAAALVVGPLAAVGVAGVVFWRHGIGWFDVILAVVMYAVTGFGLTVGFHRMLTHGSFRPARALKVALAIAGTMGVEGSAFTWVAHHRKHHAYADRDGDPHSPWDYGSGFPALLRGLGHAHVGWFFKSNPSEPQRWIPDLLTDRDLSFVSRTAVVWSALSLAIPFGIGLAVTGTWYGAWLALLWAGLVRMAVLHHVTFGVNSLGHMFGSRPFRTRDRSTNIAALALLSMGDSWHNGHHAFPTLARHGVDRHQIDLSAGLIRLFERLGWASDARWPDPARLAARRLPLVPAAVAL
ncbi:fatty acid desaturase [Acidiferrimicrobium sp. IK]|uniref:acyl-CoA desaturase n=1 Tax=Acidiferrimicrobium sp. IK TaxID=2871700 RepID=UPI0021CB2264|nr:fatty acid desaturase [Acidiferrimicrobium sp. IK]MCU4185394.1 fatty acid desaturase [Acidiferrimicrobium sp. IK]